MRFSFARVTGLVMLLLSMAGCHLPPSYSADPVVLKQALAQGADPNQDWHGWTPLNYVVYARYSRGRPAQQDLATQLANTQLLLEAGANPNVLAYGLGANNFAAPLPLAVALCQPEMAKLLLESGADPYTMTGSHGTALALTTYGYCATVDEQYTLTYMLLDHVERARGRDAMLAYARIVAPKTLRYLPIPVLHTATWQKYYGVLAALIEKRVDLDQVAAVGMPDQQWTALHLAEAVGNTDIAELLRRAGARDDVLSNYGEKPMAVRGRYVPQQASGTEIAMGLTKTATQVQSGDLIGLYKAGYNNEVRRLMYEPTLAIERTSWTHAKLGGPVKPPPGWTGLDDAIRKARKAAKPSTAGTR